LASHSFKVLSLLPDTDTICFPSGEKAQEITPFALPVIVIIKRDSTISGIRYWCKISFPRQDRLFWHSPRYPSLGLFSTEARYTIAEKAAQVFPSAHGSRAKDVVDIPAKLIVFRMN
jgi:hypothetical protein